MTAKGGRKRLVRRRVVRIIARLNVGGPAQHVTWLTAGLRAAGWASVLVCGVPPPGEQDMAGFARARGVVPLVVPQLSRNLSPRDLLVVWKLFGVLIRLRPDVVHTHTAKAGAVGRAAAWLYRIYCRLAFTSRRPRCVVVHTYHGHVFHSYFGRLKTWFYLSVERMLARLVTDRIVVLSRQQLDEIQGTFGVGRPDQYAVIPLGLDLDRFADGDRGRPWRAEMGLGPDEQLVGIVGRLTEIKNHALFLAAAQLFASDRDTAGPPVKFLIIGDGQLRDELQQQAGRLGLQRLVRFLGQRDDPERFYPALDVVALTSHNEGTPLTLLEAMANGRPVIATAVGGVVDLLGEPARQVGQADGGFTVCQRGVAVVPDDARAFAEGLAHLLADAALQAQLGQAGLQYVRAQHDKRRLIDDVVQLYEAELNERR